jgi:Zn-finger nucleic acid-binding protein
MQLIDRQRQFRCGHCDTTHVIEAPAVDGVRIVRRSESAPPCPLCAAPLADALLDETFRVEHCERCRGLTMPRQTFAEAIRRLRARQSGTPVDPAPIDPTELGRTLDCPKCQAQMDTRRYDGPGNIVIDACSRCDVIWLDYGELSRIIQAPGRDRGRP